MFSCWLKLTVLFWECFFYCCCLPQDGDSGNPCKTPPREHCRRAVSFGSWACRLWCWVGYGWFGSRCDNTTTSDKQRPRVDILGSVGRFFHFRIQLCTRHSSQRNQSRTAEGEGNGALGFVASIHRLPLVGFEGQRETRPGILRPQLDMVKRVLKYYRIHKTKAMRLCQAISHISFILSLNWLFFAVL